MKEITTTLMAERKYFVFSLLYLLVIGVVMMAQNYIRYGWHDTYNPWPTVVFLSIGLILFIAVAPIYYLGIEWIREKYPHRFWLPATAWILLTVLIFYAFSSLLLYLTTLAEVPFKGSYARFYFGRAVVFHLLYLLVTAFYLLRKERGTEPKHISGTLGRKKVTIKADQAKWIEADDHYLKVHLAEGVILTRSTLDQMTETLNPDFIRIHRKYLVNRQQVIGKEKNKRDEYLILSTGERLKVGRSYLPLDLQYAID
ncbi:LytR/AlgR family response regulator transcription factor [Flavilitoribacter nigricans]|uniref:HTH LytTR-type domain-containing protein n=1 Tax=Flavilitoribacter nigricans (strain ATCC 23147 / DSM 23189 / NBRC 102662 / NCIMB 1420 / SS-2) TaxID=1122177 RepID=A0A2D0N5D2_FLAN2|nr:LytTR family DNA-binding domain-containing protein [Flavilitoribacter nigricans]PHN03369.1 hypothetical protein CRP01_27175 [Flavilitoribacter nigricans DSM 23189 = NBRC 102662]